MLHIQARSWEVITHVRTPSERSALCSGVCGQGTVSVAGSAHFLEDWWTSARLRLSAGSLPTTRFQGLLVTDGKISGSFYISMSFCTPLVTKSKILTLVNSTIKQFIQTPFESVASSVSLLFGTCHENLSCSSAYSLTIKPISYLILFIHCIC